MGHERWAHSSERGPILRTIALRIGIIAAIGVGFLVLRPFLMGGAGDLKVGECFDEPVGDVQTVEEVQHHPCSDPHTGEVIYVGNLATAENAPFPSDAEMETMVGGVCIPAFNVYTGLDFQSDQEWTLGYFTPVEADWGTGDRSIVCYAVRIDATPTSTSIKKA